MNCEDEWSQYWKTDRKMRYQIRKDCEWNPGAWTPGTQIVEETMQIPDHINHPNYYTSGAREVIDVIFDQGWGPSYCLGNIFKYTARCLQKGNAVDDLWKIVWYATHMIEMIERLQGGSNATTGNGPQESETTAAQDPDLRGAGRRENLV